MCFPDISIIVPVYNARDTLKRLIESIDLQSEHPSCEVILVDDRSDDGSSALIDEFALKYANVSAIHNKINMGSGMTRNNALPYVRSRYIFFADADDTVIWSGIRTLYEKAEKDNYDITVGNYNRIENGKTVRGVEHISSGPVIRGNELFRRLKTDSVFGYVHTKLYRKSFLDKSGVTFDSLPFMEDQLFNLKLFADSPAYYFCDSLCYEYYIRNATLSHGSDKKIADKCRTMLDAYYLFLQKKNAAEENKDLLVPLAMRLLCWSAFKNIPFEGAKYSKIKDRLKEYSSSDSFCYIISRKDLKGELKTLPSQAQNIFYSFCFDLMRKKMSGFLALIFTLGAPLMTRYVKNVLK